MLAINLAERAYIVTGASRGMGAEMAHAIALAGGRVVLVAPERDAAELVGTTASINRDCGTGSAKAAVADISDIEACRLAARVCLSAFGRIDGLISNAGLGPMHLDLPPHASTAPFWEVDPACWADIIRVNVVGTFNMAHAVTPLLIERGWGRIVNTSTGLATIYREGGTPYGPSKGAIEAMTLAWSKELRKFGITVNSLLPGGTTDTAFVPKAVRESRALISPRVMRAPAVWLMSPLSDGLTGGRIVATRWTEGIDPAIAAQSAFEPPVYRET
ncbi:MAG: SDR family NAD(P)-dependent oxidoreductase [Beijerinckiaceae bacterium]